MTNYSPTELAGLMSVEPGEPRSRFRPYLMVFAPLFVVLVCLVSTAVAADSAQDKLHEGYRCEIGSSYRLFSLNYPDAANGGGCQVLYEKADVAEPVRPLWRARHDFQFCIDRMRGSVNKLIDAGWNCEFSTEKLTYTAPPAEPKKTPDLTAPILVNKQTGGALTPAALSPGASVSAQEPVESGPEFDDWFHRWDEAGRRLVFTLYNTRDGTKARSFSWSHQAFTPKETSPSNIVFIQNQKGQPILIVAWPGDKSQFITAIDPLRQDSPFCEIETESKQDDGWGFGMDASALVLTGQQASRDQPGQWLPVRQECALASR